MDFKIAKHILASANVEELNDFSRLVPAKAKEGEAEEISRQFGAGLREAANSLGVNSLAVKFGTEKDLSQAKGRLLTAMSVAAGLVGLGDNGDYVRGADFHGAAGAGSLSAQSLCDIVNPERPHMKGSQWILDSSSSGSLMPKSSKSKISPSGLIAVNQERVAAIAASKIDNALGGFEPIWEAVKECASNQRRLGDLGGADCWSKQELSSRLEASLSSRLEPFAMGPQSKGFPKPIDGIDFGSKLEALREAAPGAPKLSSPKAATA